MSLKLALLDELLHQLNKIQRKWVHLEPIFGRGAMPKETDRFERVDLQYRKVMRNVGATRLVGYLTTVPGLKVQRRMYTKQNEMK